MTPFSYYQEQSQQQLISADENQIKVMHELDVIYHHLLVERHKRQRFSTFLRKPKLISGLYLWGGVGIGKTFMMDCFYHAIPFKEKMRMHFHHFMQMIHQQLRQHQGKKDPLKLIAKEIAKETLVICFDEFFVKDITDAMLLANMLKALFANGVCIIMTSNVEPDELYKKGLQRQQFLPAIALIKQHTQVLHLTTAIDYRLRHLKFAGVFHTPNDQAALLKMKESFKVLTNAAEISHEPIDLHGRMIPIVKSAATVIWFDFDVICQPPRSQQDYLALTEEFHTVFISGVRSISQHDRNKIVLFIRMIDVFYDARIKLVLSSSVPVELIYPEGELQFEFKRTCSRLIEMQSETYFGSNL